ncbi:hypothetical protein FUAX_24350 [Fulvitalea axinellae]|uniref:Uncharacterized protein n=1 Tax=Fulvitalea axinellae TaxID=1182444 RepID=A0AAU9CIU2_9BACT|nr:hypothetical protein FUAX_24350 [Fulvitalea axinellae]
MKRVTFLLAFMVAVFASNIAAKADELKREDFNVESMTVSFSEDRQMIVLDLNKGSVKAQGYHTSIDLSRMDVLEYRTRVMRYFGGLLASSDRPKTIRVIAKEKVFETAFDRKNVSDIVKLFDS